MTVVQGVPGMKELDAALFKLEQVAKKKLGRAAVRSGARHIYNETQARAPVGSTGNLKSSLKVQLKRIGDRFFARVYTSHPQGPHGHLVEFGHNIVMLNKKTGKKFSIGRRVSEHPFMAPAFDAKVDAAFNTIKDKYKEALGL